MSAFTSNGWQAGFLQVMPAVETHAKIQFRFLPAEQRAELIQESIASACLAYQKLAAQGRLHVARPSTLATFAVRQAHSGRHVGGRLDGAQDVMSLRCQRRHGLQVFSYQRYPFLARSGRGDAGWRQLTIADRKDPIPDTVAFRIDFGQWLKTLTRRDRRIIAAFLRSEGTMDVAARFAVSPGRISQLRRQYERQWATFQRQAA